MFQEYTSDTGFGNGAGIAGRTVFLDVNGNGTLDAGDLSAKTDAKGNYHIDTTDVAQGIYALREVVTPGLVPLDGGVHNVVIKPVGHLGIGFSNYLISTVVPLNPSTNIFIVEPDANSSYVRPCTPACSAAFPI